LNVGLGRLLIEGIIDDPAGQHSDFESRRRWRGLSGCRAACIRLTDGIGSPRLSSKQTTAGERHADDQDCQPGHDAHGLVLEVGSESRCQNANGFPGPPGTESDAPRKMRMLILPPVLRAGQGQPQEQGSSERQEAAPMLSDYSRRSNARQDKLSAQPRLRPDHWKSSSALLMSRLSSIRRDA
jgi:hypothetical protein